MGSKSISLVLIVSLFVGACAGQKKPRLKIGKTEFLKMKHAFAEPVASSSGFRLQSATPASSGDNGKACDEKLDPMISQADAGAAALVAALAGAMAALQASTDNNKNPQPSAPNQIIATPDTGKPKTPGADNLAARAEPVGNAGFGTNERQIWKRDSGGSGSGPGGTDQYASNTDAGGKSGGSDSLSASAGAGASRDPSGGSDSFTIRPASLAEPVSVLPHGPAIAEAKTGLLTQSLSAGEGAGGAGGRPGDIEGAFNRANADPFLAQFAARRGPASVTANAAIKAGLSPQSGPSVFRIITQTIKTRCLRMQLACAANRPG